MIVAISGDIDRARAWEKHLRQIRQVREVVISSELPQRKEADALILIGQGSGDLPALNRAIRAGFHTFHIAGLYDHTEELLKIHELSREAGVQVQMSHWPSLNLSGSRIRSEIGKIEHIQVRRESPLTQGKPDSKQLFKNWSDEVALAVNWLGGNLHHAEAKPIQISGSDTGLSITLRFDDSSLASFQFFMGSEKAHHQRVFAGRSMVCETDVLSGEMRFLHKSDRGHLILREYSSDPTGTAVWSLQQFFKSIRMKSDTLFTPYTAYRSALIVDKIKKLLR